MDLFLFSRQFWVQVTAEPVEMDFRLQRNLFGWTLGYKRTHSDGLQVRTGPTRMDFRLEQNPLRWTLGQNRTHSDRLQVRTEPTQMDFRLQQNPLDGLQVTTEPTQMDFVTIQPNLMDLVYTLYRFYRLQGNLFTIIPH